jgi:hypothetical protein
MAGKSRSSALSCGAALIALAVAAIPLPPPDDVAFDWRATAEVLRPKPEELTWKAIGWRSTFFDAVKEAQRERRPVLLWAMNGHPLACT